jgi:hypothetical protein
MRLVLPLLLAVTIVAACGGDGDGGPRPRGALTRTPAAFDTGPRDFPYNTPDNRTPYPGVAHGYHSFDGAEPLPELPAGAAVYLTLGDSVQWGCCDDPNFSSHPRFAAYLSQRLNRQVVWLSLASNGTLRGFLGGELGNRPQLEVAEETIAALRRDGHDVVLISLSTGGNDILELRTNMGCTGGGRPDCIQAFTGLMVDFGPQMQEIYSRLNAVKHPATPIFQNNLYDAMDCGQPGAEISSSAVAMGIYNDRVYSATLIGGAFLVDFETAFKGHACEYISGVDPTYTGYDVILALDIAAYEALPAEYVDPWVR